MSRVRRRSNRRRREPRDFGAWLRRAYTCVRATAVVALLGAAGWAAVSLLDRPVEQVTIEGPFQRVTARHLEGVVRNFLPAGVLAVDLAAVRAAVTTLDWIDRATVERRWPDALHVTVTEQMPAARWGENGLLNVRGELFVTEARHVPAELPRLDGPPGSEWQVAQRYLAMRDRLLEAGLALSALTLDARGAWNARLANGVEVRLGREQSDRRIELFVALVAPMIAARAGDVDYVDMRYSNGFAIGWQRDGEAREAEVLAGA